MIIHEPEHNCATFFMKTRVDLETLVIEDVKDVTPEVDEMDEIHAVVLEDVQTLAQVSSKTKQMKPEHNGNVETLGTCLMTVQTSSTNQEVVVVAVEDTVDVDTEDWF